MAASTDVRTREESKLLGSLRRRGLVPEGVTLDGVLSLSVEDLLGRRLQTLIYKKGAAVSPLQARQLIVHGHVKLGTRTVDVPGYNVTAEEEGSIHLTGGIGTPKPPAPPPSTEASAVAAVPPPPAPPAESQQQQQQQSPQAPAGGT